MARLSVIARATAITGLVVAFAGGTGFAEEPAATLKYANATRDMTPASGSAGVVETVDPRVNASVPDSVRSKLESSFALAVERVREGSRCRALFTELGVDGVEVLRTTRYYPAELKFELRVCPRAHAYTVVGGVPTWLCRNFSRLSDERAAMVLLHEALHHAGVDESHDRSKLMSPREIDRMLSRNCAF